MLIDEEIERRERRFFVGRRREMSAFSDALNEGSSGRIFDIYGPGGIGKSYLLREMHRTAGEHGALSFFIDGDDMEASVRSFLANVGFQLRARGFSTGESSRPRAVTAAEIFQTLYDAGLSSRLVFIIDTYEKLANLDHWLRERFIRSMPARSIFVIGGRRGLEGEWVESPAWRSLVSSFELKTFSYGETLDCLSNFGISDEGLAANIHSFSTGHPLVVSLAAQLADTRLARLPSASRSDILQTLARRWLEDIDDPQLGDLVKATAVLESFNREKLSFVLGRAVPDALGAKLESLWFMKPTRYGWSMHKLVRSAIVSRFQRKHPNLFHRIRAAASVYFYERIRAGSRDERDIGRFFYYAGDDMMRSAFFMGSPDNESRLYLEQATPATLSDVEQYFRRRQRVVSRDEQGPITVDFQHPESDQLFTHRVSESHNRRESELMAATRLRDLGAESFYMLRDQQGQKLGIAVIIPIHRGTLPQLAAMPVSRAYFRNLNVSQERFYSSPPSEPAGVFIRMLDWVDLSEASHRSFTLYNLFPLLLSQGHIIASTPLAFFVQLLQRFGFDKIEGATHYDFGPHLPTDTYMLDLTGARLTNYLKTFISRELADYYSDLLNQKFDFTPREQEVLALVLRDLSNADIARALHITEVTVKKHVGGILKKSRASSRADLTNMLP